MLIALAIFLFLVGGVITANLFGLRMFQMTQTKLNVTRWSRETVMRLTDEIHVCNSAQVGVISNGMFVGLLDGDVQQGNALYISPSTDTNSYILYFVDTDDRTFRRSTDEAESTVVLASSVTNVVPFSAQDMTGNVLTNNANNKVIHITLEFYQPEKFMQSADYYKLDTSVKQRVVP